MRRVCLLLTLISVFAGSCLAQEKAEAVSADDPEVRKFHAALAFFRNRNVQDYAVTPANGIDEAKYVEVGGIQQWISIRGDDRANPVLLLLHGGPGDATNPWGYAGFRSWRKHFTVVQWDQRGAGRTLGKSGSSLAPTITIDRITRDGVELAELLRKSLRKDKIVLVGHSWGSTLAVFMVKARPDLFSAFVGTGQVADRPGPTQSPTTTFWRRRGASATSGRFGSSVKSARRRTRTVVATLSSVGGRTSSKAQTSSSRPCLASPSRRRATRCAT